VGRRHTPMITAKRQAASLAGRLPADPPQRCTFVSGVAGVALKPILGLAVSKAPFPAVAEHLTYDNSMVFLLFQAIRNFRRESIAEWGCY
jgi:hypothetical protein